MFKQIILGASVLCFVLSAVLHAQDPDQDPGKLDSQPSVSDALVAEPIESVEPIGDTIPQAKLDSQSAQTELASPAPVAESLSWPAALGHSVDPMHLPSVMMANSSPENVFSPSPSTMMDSQQTLFSGECQVCCEPVTCCRNRKKKCCLFRGILFRGRR